MYQLGPGLWPLSSHQGGRAGNKRATRISITVRLNRGPTLRDFILSNCRPLFGCLTFRLWPELELILHEQHPPSFWPGSRWPAVGLPAVLGSEEFHPAYFT